MNFERESQASAIKGQLTGAWTKHVDFRFIAGEDLEKDTTLTIKSVVKEEVFNPNSNSTDMVMILYFEETKKGIIVGSKKVGNALTRVLGTKEVQDWPGKKVTFWGEPHKRFGKVVRVKTERRPL